MSICARCRRRSTRCLKKSNAPPTRSPALTIAGPWRTPANRARTATVSRSISIPRSRIIGTGNRMRPHPLSQPHARRDRRDLRKHGFIWVASGITSIRCTSNFDPNSWIHREQEGTYANRGGLLNRRFRRERRPAQAQPPRGFRHSFSAACRWRWRARWCGNRSARIFRRYREVERRLADLDRDLSASAATAASPPASPAASFLPLT